MSTTEINYDNFQLDWWDTVGTTAEMVKIGIENSINETFGSGGVAAIQKQAIIDASFQNYQAQEAMKAAAKAAQEAAQYADLPESSSYKNAISTVRAYENIASKAISQAKQVMQNSKADVYLVNNMSKVVSALGPAINIAQLGSSAATGDAYEVGKTAVSVLAGMAFGALVIGLAGVSLSTAVVGIGIGLAASHAWSWMWDNGAAR